MIRLLFFLCCTILASAGEADLLVAAQQARAAAAAELAAQRSTCFAERVACAERLAAAQARAAAALTAAAAAQARRTAAAKARSEAVVSAQQAGRDAEALLAAAAQALGLPTAGTSAPQIAAALDQRLHLLASRLPGVTEESVTDRDGQTLRAPVWRLGPAHALAWGATPASRGFLTHRPDGAPLVSGPLPPPPGPDRVAVDLDGSWAKRSGGGFIAWLQAGRFFIWPILAAGLCGLALATGAVWRLWRSRMRPDLIREVLVGSAAGQADAAAALVAGRSDALQRILANGLSLRDRPDAEREAAMEACLASEAAQLTRHLAAIQALAAVAPLLGLLGTVTGMVDLFGQLSAQGGGAARSLSGGIGEALIATQAGLLVAVPLLLLHAGLARIAERRLLLLEEASAAVLGLPRPVAPA